jgi:glycosyltransferase involved in cell wall biosynthesis
MQMERRHMSAHSDLSIVAIIPLYNGARWIEQAITSVLSQTLPPDEFIVVDDGSTDGGAGAAIVQRMAREHPIITLLRKPNGGQSSARNFAVARSKSALIALLDQDDYWYPDHLEELRRPFETDRHGKISWVYSDLDRVDESGSMFCHQFLSTLPNDHPKRHIFKCLKQDMFVLPSASLIFRKAFESVGGFDERLMGYEDDDLFLRLFRVSRENVFICKPLSAWRIFPSSTSYTTRMAKSRMIYLDKLVSAFPDEKRTHTYYLRDAIAPRFVKTILADIIIASQEPDWQRVRQNAADLYIAAARLRPTHRLIARALAPLLRIRFMVRPTLIAGLIIRRVIFPRRQKA